ncbi:MAG: T9SS type A sorting domain-containing protein [Bacteroidia bacterium]|nr:T9SS type A sorting domain-containing protein [Bacteroidia bacterium]
MKNKIFILTTLLAANVSLQAQIIPPPIPIPDSIPEYNGTYEDIGQNHLFYPNGGEIRFNDKTSSSAIDNVAYYTKYAWPQQYLLYNNNISFVFSKRVNPAGTPVDSLHRIDLEMERSNSSAYLARVDTQNFAVLNYLTEWFSSSGRMDVKGSAAIACQSIYPNIDMVYTSNNTGLKIYYIVYPGGDPNNIILHVNGSKSNNLSGNDLVINANWNSIKFVKPKMYQYTLSNNIVTPVNVCPASWQPLGADRYKITTSTPWNPTLPLIIQVSQGVAAQASVQGLMWSTYFGGTQWDLINKSHFDSNGNLYVGGQSASNSLPNSTGPIITIQGNSSFIDGFISKFNSLGQIVWSTFIGGSSDEEIFDFDFNGGNIYCVGKTSSSNLGTATKSGAGVLNNSTFGGGVYDGFILQIGFATNGAMINKWTTYLGGNGEDELRGCKFDNSGNLFVVGSSASTNLALVGSTGMYQKSFNSAQLSQSTLPVTDAIITKFDAGTSAQSWFTFYGTDSLGTNAHSLAADKFYGIAIYGNDVYACGKAGGTNLPGKINSKFVPGNYDGILANFTTGGAINNSKFTDGNIVNYAVNAEIGLVFTVGQANSLMSPVNSGNYYYDGTCATSDYDACFSVNGLNLSTAIHNTFLGGSFGDAAFDIDFANNYVFYIAGGTYSNDFPTTALFNMYSSNANGNLDNFVVAFSIGNPNMKWGTYLGSPDQETQNLPYGGTSIAINGSNVLHISGCSASYNTFPLHNGLGIPHYQWFNPSINIGSTGTITRFDMIGINGTVGLTDFPNTAFAYGLYPNPTTNYLLINNSDLLSNELRYAIYDLTGKKLAEGNLANHEIKQIDVSFLMNGVYIVNVSNGTKTFSNKFIKAEN